MSCLPFGAKRTTVPKPRNCLAFYFIWPGRFRFSCPQINRKSAKGQSGEGDGESEAKRRERTAFAGCWRSNAHCSMSAANQEPNARILFADVDAGRGSASRRVTVTGGALFFVPCIAVSLAQWRRHRRGHKKGADTPPRRCCLLLPASSSSPTCTCTHTQPRAAGKMHMGVRWALRIVDATNLKGTFDRNYILG